MMYVPHTRTSNPQTTQHEDRVDFNCLSVLETLHCIPFLHAV